MKKIIAILLIVLLLVIYVYALEKKVNGDICSSGSDCEGGFCIRGVCASTPYIIGDLSCDPGESCSTSSDCECRNTEVCISGRCKLKNGESCSDGSVCAGKNCVKGVCSSYLYIKRDDYCNKNDGENCYNSPDDCSCGLKYCEPRIKECVTCYLDEHCQREEPVYREIGRSCSQDNHKIIIEREVDYQKCSDFNCLTFTENEFIERYCGLNFCQDGACGCKEGYLPCEASGKCELVEELSDGNFAFCDFQCKSRFLDGGICKIPLNFKLNIENPALKKGESSNVYLNIDNQMDMDISAKATLNIQGAVISALSNFQAGSPNQITSSFVIPAKSEKTLSAYITMEDENEILLSSIINYNIGEKEFEEIHNKEILIERITENVQDEEIAPVYNNLGYSLILLPSVLGCIFLGWVISKKPSVKKKLKRINKQAIKIYKKTEKKRLHIWATSISIVHTVFSIFLRFWDKKILKARFLSVIMGR